MNDAPAVECYSGSRYAERPLAVHIGGRRLAVEQVLRRWRAPAGPGFDVQVAGGRRFRLEFHEEDDHWAVSELSFASNKEPD